MNEMKFDDVPIGVANEIHVREGDIGHVFDFGEYGKLSLIVRNNSVVKYERTSEKVPTVWVQSLTK